MEANPTKELDNQSLLQLEDFENIHRSANIIQPLQILGDIWLHYYRAIDRGLGSDVAKAFRAKAAELREAHQKTQP